ncbi:MAG: nucleotidyltransferase domain-containing protein [Actinobacteria bacterium]|nr:nucleotidyltransferase domain-containing protein [Actinomycetota bacterium]
MGQAEVKVDKEVLRFIQNIKSNFNIVRVILFGSRAGNAALKDSDYDFVVVSPDFEGIFFTARTKMLYNYWRLPQALEALCYTPAEFNEKAGQITIVREAVREGIDLTAA